MNTLTVAGSAGRRYTISVNAHTKQAQCSCPAFRYRRVACKHIYQALATLTTQPRRLTLV